MTVVDVDEEESRQGSANQKRLSHLPNVQISLKSVTHFQCPFNAGTRVGLFPDATQWCVASKFRFTLQIHCEVVKNLAEISKPLHLLAVASCLLCGRFHLRNLNHCGCFVYGLENKLMYPAALLGSDWCPGKSSHYWLYLTEIVNLKWHFLNLILFGSVMFSLMPPHVHTNFRGPPSWLWRKCNRLLRLGRPWGAVTLSRWCEGWCIGRWGARRVLKV